MDPWHTNHQAAQALHAAIRNGDAVLWIGSGPSKDAYGSWSRAVSKLCRVCGQECLPDSEPTPDQLMDKAEACKLANRETYEQQLGKIFGKTASRTREAYHTLVKLPFAAFLTTNFDPLLANAHRHEHIGPRYDYPDLPLPNGTERSRPAYYLHGMAQDHDRKPSGKNLVFARSDFDEAYGQDSLLPGLLKHVLTYLKIVFVGCELSEPDIIAVFQRVRSIQERIGSGRVPKMPWPKGYVLLPVLPTRRASVQAKPGDEQQQERVLQSMAEGEASRWRGLGIHEIICYDQQDKKYTGLDDVLERTWDLVQQQSADEGLQT